MTHVLRRVINHFRFVDLRQSGRADSADQFRHAREPLGPHEFSRRCADSKNGSSGWWFGTFFTFPHIGNSPSYKWDFCRVNPLIIGVITHLLSGVSHQVIPGCV